MVLPTVDLDDNAMVRIDEVDAIGSDALLSLRRGQLVATRQPKELALELALRDAALAVVEQPKEQGHAAKVAQPACLDVTAHTGDRHHASEERCVECALEHASVDAAG
jgi:hypothetical protein